MFIIPNKCLFCHKTIEHERSYGDGLVQMNCKVHGFPPFLIEACLSWCSVEHFLKWWEKNLEALNVVEKIDIK